MPPLVSVGESPTFTLDHEFLFEMFLWTTPGRIIYLFHSPGILGENFGPALRCLYAGTLRSLCGGGASKYFQQLVFTFQSTNTYRAVTFEGDRSFTTTDGGKPLGIVNANSITLNPTTPKYHGSKDNSIA